MTKTVLSLASLALPACWLGAALPQPVAISTDLTYTSDYVFRGIRLAEESFQPTIEAAVGDVYAGVWANLPTGAADSEINYYGGFGFDIPEVDFVTFDAGLTVYHYPDTGSDRTHEFYLGGNFSIPQLPQVAASLFYYYDVDIESHVGEGALTYVYSLEGIGLPASLDFSVEGGLQGGSASGLESYHYYGGSIALPYALTEFSAITATVSYATAEKYSFGEGQRGQNLFWSIGYSTSL